MPRVYIWCILLCSMIAVRGQQPRTFTLRECFGIAHARQLLEAPFPAGVDAAQSRLLGPDGTATPFQVLDGGNTLTFITDLPAHAEQRWTLAPGVPAPAPDGIRVTETPAYYQITNGLTGVRVAKAATELAPPLAPVQGIQLRDGTWTGTGPNLLVARNTTWKTMAMRFVERGPLLTRIEVRYTLTRPDLRSNQNNAILIPGGEGYYASTITVKAGQPSLLFEEDTDTDVQYSINLYPGIEPTQARYHGHHATKEAYGRLEGGGVYTGAYGTPQDALLDLRYDRRMDAIYATSDASYRYMAVWDPWVFDGGWYWQLYRAAGPAESNVVGIFAGAPSRAVGAAASGVGVFTIPDPKAAGITVACVRLCADTRYFPRIRYAWGLFTGVKGQDLKPVTEIQPINRQMNIHGGINLSKVARWPVAYPDPPQGYGALYMPKAAVQRLIEKLRTDKAFYQYCYNTEPQSRGLIELMADTTGAKVHTAAKEVIDGARWLLERYVNGEGIYARPHYWEGGQYMTEKAVWIDLLLASAQLTPEERVTLKAIHSAFGHILWDDDFVPLTLPHGLNLAQGPVQYLGFRAFYAIVLSGQPVMQARAAEVERMTLSALPAIINEHGAGVACTHYMSPYVATSLNTLLQLALLGRDHYRTEPRLAKFAEGYLHFLTPPEPRFGGKRKYIATSDSSTESSELYGVLATAFRAANPALSARLMGAWHAGGRHLDPRFGSCLLRIDTEAPSADPQLGSAAVPGYFSVLRHGWGQPHETAAWVINGDFYREHRHPDQGMVVLYALGAPVSVHWSSLYYPQVSGAFMNSTALLESMLPTPWDGDSPPLNAGGGWSDSTADAFLDFPASGYARQHYSAKGATWTRTLASIHPRDDRPVLLIRDSFTGEQAAAPRVVTLNLLAQGAVETPAGPMTPLARTCPQTQTPTKAQLPSTGPIFALPAGLNRLGFTGQHGVDWDVYTLTETPQQAYIGNWAVSWHQEKNPFEERQHILRVRGQGSLLTLLLPWRAGAKPAGLRVTHEGVGVRIATFEDQLDVWEHGYAYAAQTRTTLAAFAEARISANGLAIAGGPAEAVMEGTTATVTVHGAPGTRTVTLPGAWTPVAAKAPAKLVNGAWQVAYAGGAPQRIMFRPVKK